MSIDLKALCFEHWGKYEVESQESLLDLTRQVAAAVKREDAKRCDMYIRLLDSCGHTAEADEVRHLQRHFLEDADAIEQDKKDYADRDAERARAEREL